MSRGQLGCLLRADGGRAFLTKAAESIRMSRNLPSEGTPAATSPQPQPPNRRGFARFDAALPRAARPSAAWNATLCCIEVYMSVSIGTPFASPDTSGIAAVREWRPRVRYREAAQEGRAGSQQRPGRSRPRAFEGSHRREPARLQRGARSRGAL